MKKIYLSLILVAFVSLLFVNCESDDEVIEEIEVVVPVDPISLEREEGGQDAINILTEQVYTSLTIELAYLEGNRPQQKSLDSLTVFINKRVNKSGGITYVETVLPSETMPSGVTLPYDKELEIEQQYRTQFRSETNLALWILMVDEVMLNEDGTNDDDTIGFVYSNTGMVLSIPNITSTAEGSPISGYDGVEASTLQHEFCHWLGIFGPRADALHEAGEHEGIGDDGDGTGHCKVPTCLMFYSSNNPLHGGCVSRFQSEFLVELDALCIADLQALGGK